MNNWQPAFEDWCKTQLNRLENSSPVTVYGRIKGIKGILLESYLPQARIGDLCKIQGHQREALLAEVVGFNPQYVLLSALGPLDGVAQEALVVPLYLPHTIKVSAHLLGNVLDGFGRPLEATGTGAFVINSNTPGAVKVLRPPIMASERPRIDSILTTGLRAIDGMLTLGIGQRIAVFAGAGCGKTTLLAELARNASCDVIVFALVGERGRELREFLEHELDAALRKKTVVVCATSDRSSMERTRAAFTATAIAEGFRDEGKDVLLIIDSLTRFARAQREIGLALGEPLGRGGLPPSVYTLLPDLVERAGRAPQGSITAIYSVLIEQDSMNDPVADEVRSLIDGHIILSRRLVQNSHFPAIDILQSLSRIMPNIVNQQQIDQANMVRRMMAAHNEVELLIRLGEYQQGNDKFTDNAINAQHPINDFLRQSLRDPADFTETLDSLEKVSQYGYE